MKLIYGFSTVEDGNMSVKYGKEDEALGNRQQWLTKMGIKYDDCVFMSLNHGTDIYIVTGKDKGKIVEGDGLITEDKNLALFMVTADCLPVIFQDNQSIGLAHLGWQGVNKKLAQKIIQDSGFRIQDTRIIIGPGVRKESYIKYGEKLDYFLNETADNRNEWKEFIIKMDQSNRYKIDLVGYVIKQLKDVGIEQDNIEVSPVDTIIDTNYFSHYRAGETGEKEGRFATVVELK